MNVGLEDLHEVDRSSTFWSERRGNVNRRTGCTIRADHENFIQDEHERVKLITGLLLEITYWTQLPASQHRLVLVRSKLPSHLVSAITGFNFERAWCNRYVRGTCRRTKWTEWQLLPGPPYRLERGPRQPIGLRAAKGVKTCERCRFCEDYTSWARVAGTCGRRRRPSQKKRKLERIER